MGNHLHELSQWGGVIFLGGRSAHQNNDVFNHVRNGIESNVLRRSAFSGNDQGLLMGL